MGPRSVQMLSQKQSGNDCMKMLLVLSWRYSFLSKLVVFGVYFYKPKDRNFKLQKISSS